MTKRNGSKPRTFKTPAGVELIPHPISATIFQFLRNSFEAQKPQPPIVEVTIAGQTYAQPNADDPDYKESVEVWQGLKNEAVARYIIAEGVANDPPEDYVKATRRYLPKATAEDMRYLWVMSLFDDNLDTLGDLSEFIMSQTMATEKGLERVKESFPGDD